MSRASKALGFFIGAAALAGNARAQDAYVPDHFPTIATALAQATDVDGDGILEIRVRPGVYLENILIARDDVSLSGEERDTTIIQGDGTTDTLRIENAFAVSIDTLTVTGGGLLNDGISLERSSACVIDNCLVTNSRRGIDIDRSPGNTISTCIVRSSAGAGIRITRSNGVLVRSNTSTMNFRQGFDVVLNDGVSLIENVANDNRLDGIRIGAGSYSQVNSNRCERNGVNGILSGRGDQNVFYDNHCSRNHENGIRLQETHYYIVSDNTFTSNDDYGIRRRLWDLDDYDAGAPGAQPPSGANDVSGNDDGGVRDDS
ncbi:MAG: right-handed parallel beta-helix repeat-containing protein [Planctomycetes bacterium]|nr:right-handed parallel beta-helix repeat-containing protein [Planctomycetota bacterium]MBI3845563.1 right-handed parallel beta-helix repeat-containing protein [Planctomycetota bacterium]